MPKYPRTERTIMASADPDRTSVLPQVGGLRRSWLAAVAAVLVLAGLGLTALVARDGRPASEITAGTVPTVPVSAAPEPTAALKPASAPTTTAPAPERLSNASRLSLDGIGPVD